MTVKASVSDAHEQCSGSYKSAVIGDKFYIEIVFYASFKFNLPQQFGKSHLKAPLSARRIGHAGIRFEIHRDRRAVVNALALCYTLSVGNELGIDEGVAGYLDVYARGRRNAVDLGYRKPR